MTETKANFINGHCSCYSEFSVLINIKTHEVPSKLMALHMFYFIMLIFQG